MLSYRQGEGVPEAHQDLLSLSQRFELGFGVSGLGHHGRASTGARDDRRGERERSDSERQHGEQSE